MAGGHGAQLVAKWERLTRLEEAIKDVSRVIGDDAQNIHTAWDVATKSQWSFMYEMVFLTCTGDKAREGSDKCYNFACEMAKRYASPKGRRRDVFILTCASVFKYLDHFYVKRWSLPTVATMMRTAMDEAIADRHRLRTAFKSWACDEELMGPTHADGGAAKKRMCLEWSNVLKQCHSY